MDFSSDKYNQIQIFITGKNMATNTNDAIRAQWVQTEATAKAKIESDNVQILELESQIGQSTYDLPAVQNIVQQISALDAQIADIQASTKNLTTNTADDAAYNLATDKIIALNKQRAALKDEQRNVVNAAASSLRQQVRVLEQDKVQQYSIANNAISEIDKIDGYEATTSGPDSNNQPPPGQITVPPVPSGDPAIPVVTSPNSETTTTATAAAAGPSSGQAAPAVIAGEPVPTTKADPAPTNSSAPSSTGSAKGLQGAIIDVQTKATAQDAANYAAKGDWRVRLALAPKADYLYKAKVPGINRSCLFYLYNYLILFLIQ